MWTGVVLLLVGLLILYRTSTLDDPLMSRSSLQFFLFFSGALALAGLVVIWDASSSVAISIALILALWVITSKMIVSDQRVVTMVFRTYLGLKSQGSRSETDTLKLTARLALKKIRCPQDAIESNISVWFRESSEINWPGEPISDVRMLVGLILSVLSPTNSEEKVGKRCE